MGGLQVWIMGTELGPEDTGSFPISHTCKSFFRKSLDPISWTPYTTWIQLHQCHPWFEWPMKGHWFAIIPVPFISDWNHVKKWEETHLLQRIYFSLSYTVFILDFVLVIYLFIFFFVLFWCISCCTVLCFPLLSDFGTQFILWNPPHALNSICTNFCAVPLICWATESSDRENFNCNHLVFNYFI